MLKFISYQNLHLCDKKRFDSNFLPLLPHMEPNGDVSFIRVYLVILMLPNLNILICSIWIIVISTAAIIGITVLIVADIE